MNFIMIGLLLREALDRLRVRLNMYLVILIRLETTELSVFESIILLLINQLCICRAHLQWL